MARKRARGRAVDGILLLDKPGGITSNHALQRVKRLYDAAKAGHTGSLDPLATGMLPICLGAATKLSGYLLDARKTYAVTAALGASTDTGDADGEIVQRAAAPPPDTGRLRDVLKSFLGESEQIPPMYSALKRGGRPLYELARRGIDVEREARPIRIDEIELTAYEFPELSFEVTCSKGTYVRTLVEDVAEALGTLGHVTRLRRLAVEPFDPDAMVTLEAIERAAESGNAALDALLLPVDSPLEGWPRVDLDAAQAARLAHGQSVPADGSWPRGRVRLDAAGAGFLGIGEVLPHGELVSRRLFL
ncbi:MAG: tRNA pseudouridine(55) synthase TruB [Gammaproteobacteria bacterium]|nr:tRNA pseudouridine(55) synthase TruB [Gammaproteobacteria bacterium]